MGSNIYEQYNNEKKMAINIELNKVCYFPEEFITGTITIFPKLEIIDSLNENPVLIIRLEESNNLTYQTGNSYNDIRTIKENIILIYTILNFKDQITEDYSEGKKIPFSVQIPKVANPTIFVTSAYVRHFFIVEIPCCEAKRTKIIIIKNIFPEKVLTKNIEINYKYKKYRCCSNKGSVLLKIKLPKNYFFYNDEIPFEAIIDCSKLDLKIKSIKVFLYRIINSKKINIGCCSKEPLNIDKKEIIFKEITLEKGLSNYNICNFINIPAISSDNPSNLYEVFEKHGLYEVNEGNFVGLCPYSNSGLLLINFFLMIKLHYDNILTSDDEVINIPLYFTENNNCNLSLKNQVFNTITYKFENDDNLIQNTY